MLQRLVEHATASAKSSENSEFRRQKLQRQLASSRRDRTGSKSNSPEHQQQIRFLQVALHGIVTKYEYDKLVGLSSDHAFPCYYSDDLYAEMKRLRAMDLVRNYDGTGLSAIRRDYKDRNLQFDLRRFFFITDAGREYLALRREVQDEQGEA